MFLAQCITVMLIQNMKDNMEYDCITFIVFSKEGKRFSVPTRYREGIEAEEDAAWDWINSEYPDAEYIEQF